MTALEGVNLAIGESEWVAIVGPSGSGKTSLLQLFSALEAPSSGQVLFEGRNLAAHRDLNGYRRFVVGLVFQLHNLLPHLSVRSNIEIATFGTHLHARDRVTRIDELLSRLDLEGQQERSPPELSGGERQRVAIARALVNRPRILLADEPTGSLDDDHVESLLALLRAEKEERGMTIAMVTHDDDVALTAQRIVTIVDGHVVEDSGAGRIETPDQVLSRRV
jgi:putative ABC transport system ATP-binding protein